ncbi:MSMEG_6728 family protein [Halopolyspora algeriensis]|uniref:MSMEG_6728 family protein n=1 Tax=Halopolyspora algeriensis TaxID=1500506 RepID=UPI000DF2F564|nr:MSMEG_6728 family protein [Halopolyspora algeriensis]
MQTFLPWPDFSATAHILDPRRLGKQRVEALQVLRALTTAGYGWRHHPAASMWSGYEEALARYGIEICRAWCATGRADTCARSLRDELERATGTTEIRTQDSLAAAGELPPWLGDPQFHHSHQSALLRKAPEHYRRWFADVPPDLDYEWPKSDRPRRTPHERP